MLLALLVCNVFASSQGAGLEIGYSNVYRDSLGEAATIQQGYVPVWINGSFIRHSCGAFGETGSELSIVNKVNHIFDCLEMGQSFSFDNGKVTFWNRYYDTAQYEIWKHFDYNMNDSRVFWVTVYAEYDFDQYIKMQPWIQNSSTIEGLPHVSFWQLGDKVLAHSEGSQSVQIDPHDVTNAREYFHFNDNNFGYTNEMILDECPHEVYEGDGSFWTNHMTYKSSTQNGETVVKQWRNIFSTSTEAVRTTLMHIEYPDLDLSLCTGGVYPIIKHRQGYIHSFTMTENYLILPETSYLAEPCNLFVYNYTGAPFYTHAYTWEEDMPSRIWVIRKSDGRIIANISTDPFFVTHQLNAYEQGDVLYADMLTYNTSDIYTLTTFVDQLLRPEANYNTSVTRFILNMTDWILQERFNILADVMPLEMSNINQAFIAKPYHYAYVVHGMYIDTTQVVMKIHVDNGDVTEYHLPAGLYPQEPWFVAEPGETEEDHGVVMVQGLDVNREKGFLIILDARDMALICHVTGTDVVLFGIHNKFYPGDVGRMNGPVDSADLVASNMSVRLLLLLTMMRHFI